MKKIKVFLTAGAVFAIVGTSLAFKANFGSGNRFCIAGGGSGTCPTSANFVPQSGGTALHCGTVSGSTTQCQSTQATTAVVSVAQ